ncbi:MAG: TonB-dependent receptor [Ferruginibacter sp.]|nr:TonB-dependent receptor [Cytophagales bacterium]
MKKRQKLWLALWLGFGLPTGLWAQGTGANLTGYVVNTELKEPIIGASVQARNESTGFTTGTITDVSGKFLLKDLPLGGPYSLTISYLGYGTTTRKGYQLSQGDLIETGETALAEGQTLLNEVVVTANDFKTDKARLGNAKKISGQTLNRIPTATRNYQALANLSPLSRGSIAAGSKAGMTGYLLDGVSNRRNVFGDLVGGAFPVSLEAIREFEVVNNAYDVTNGRGGGSVIKAVTKSGTNDFHGSAFGYYSGNFLTGDQFVRDDQGSRKTAPGDFTISQYGVSLSGPLIKDKLHFFVTADRYSIVSPYNVENFETAGSTLPEAEKNLGITKDNMDEIVRILEGPTFQVPVPPHGQQYGSIQAPNNTFNLLARFDLQFNPRHQLTMRYNYHSFYNPRKIKGGGLFSTQYEERSYDHSLLFSLRSQLSTSVTNDLRASFSDVKRPNQLIYNRAPVGRVDVRSVFADGTSRTRQVYWGNQYWIPEIIHEQNYQIINNTNFIVGKNLFTLGADALYNQLKDNLTHYQQGEFFYESIDALRANRPYRYERKTPVNGVGGFKKPYVLELGLYGQMETNLTPNLSLVAGLRWDATWIPKKPNYNATLEQELGLRNNTSPFDWTGFQPRLNLTWDLKGDGNDILKLGAGQFVSQFTTQVLTMTHIDNGVDYKTVVADTRLPGFTQADLPPANWPSYFNDFERNIPGQPYIDQLVANGKFTEPAALVIMLDENLRTPKTLKLNLNYYKYLTDWLNVGAGIYYNRTVGNYYFENRNLHEPYFTLPSEGNREVYVPLEALQRSPLQAPYDLARKSNRFTQVLEFTNADWAATFWAFVVEANLKVRDGQLNLSYTRGASKGSPLYNAGDATEFHFVGQSYQNWGRDLANTYDSEDLRHKVIVSGVSPSFFGFTFSSNFIAQQADRFTASIAGGRDIQGINLNAPGGNASLPFIFDPNDASTPEYLRTGMTELLAKTSPEYRKYLEDNLGTFAPAFGGLQPWRYSWDVSVVKQFRLFKSKSQKLEIRTDIFNFLHLLNTEWGGYHEVYNNQLYNSVEGFNATDQRWNYALNKDAGKKRYRTSTPYQVHLGVKYIF